MTRILASFTGQEHETRSPTGYASVGQPPPTARDIPSVSRLGNQRLAGGKPCARPLNALNALNGPQRAASARGDRPPALVRPRHNAVRTSLVIRREPSLHRGLATDPQETADLDRCRARDRPVTVMDRRSADRTCHDRHASARLPTRSQGPRRRERPEGDKNRRRRLSDVTRVAADRDRSEDGERACFATRAFDSRRQRLAGREAVRAAPTGRQRARRPTAAWRGRATRAPSLLRREPPLLDAKKPTAIPLEADCSAATQ
jgi:hypothetical protein